jgi:hypothetical protein
VISSRDVDLVVPILIRHRKGAAPRATEAFRMPEICYLVSESSNARIPGQGFVRGGYCYKKVIISQRYIYLHAGSPCPPDYGRIGGVGQKQAISHHGHFQGSSLDHVTTVQERKHFRGARRRKGSRHLTIRRGIDFCSEVKLRESR